MVKNTSFRNARKKNFTQISNELLGDERVSLEAKALLTIFLSNTEDWKIQMKEIIKRSKNGRDAHYRVLDELIEHGYIARVEIRNSNGKFENQEYIFSDDKEEVVQSLEEVNQWAKENKKQTDITYCVKKSKKKRTDKKKDQPFPDFQDTAKNPFPENQDTENQDTENADTESQYINNTKGDNTKNNNTKGDNTNLSINGSIIQKLDLPISIQQTLIKKIDRLIDDSINLKQIENTYKAYQHKITEHEFNFILDSVLEHTEGRIQDIKAVMNKSIKNHTEKPQQAEKEHIKSRNEVLPDWFKERNQENSYNADETEKKQQPVIDLEKEKRELREFMNAASNNN